MDTTGLAGLTVESLSELVRGMAGVGADVLDGVGQDSEVDLDLEGGLGSADAVQSAVVSEVE
jgi:hypothetical protein